MAVSFKHESDLADLQAMPLARVVQRACVRGMGSWAADRRAGLGARLSSTSWSIYNWTRRSANYTARVVRSWGSALPYVSPRKRGYGGVGKMLYVLTVPGRGHNVYEGQRTDTEGEAILTVPAARGLNFSARKGRISTYLAEWARVYPHEAVAISERIDRIAAADLAKLGART